MEQKENTMKRLTLVLLAVAGLAGCVAVPVAEPGVYVAPPTVVVQPYFYGGYYYRGGYGPRHRW
jgi:hypothetical protein